MMSKKEKDVWGTIGQPPPEVLEAPMQVTRAWKDLVKVAKKVVRMRKGPTRTHCAKMVEHRRNALIIWAIKIKQGENVSQDEVANNTAAINIGGQP